MIARLVGTVAEKGEDSAIVDVNGVGYRVHFSALAMASLPPVGERLAVRIFTKVSDDAIALFGFLSEEEEGVFHALVSVDRIGPRAAQNILSKIEARNLALAVVQGDLAVLGKAVGKKTAERLVVELREKLAALARGARSAKAPIPSGPLDQLVQALVGLGYKPIQAEQAAEKLSASAAGRSVEELLREALKLMRG